MGSEAYLIRIVALWGRVTKYINQGGRLNDVNPPWTPDSGFAKLSSELQVWNEELPYWLKYSSSNLADQVAISQAPSFVFMHIAYHTIVCTLHRFSVPSSKAALKPQNKESSLLSLDPPLDFLQRSVKICFEHAKAISKIMAEVVSRPDCIVTVPFLGFAVFTANLFHLHQAFTPCPYVDESPEEAREFFATGVTVLNGLRIWWGPLEILYRTIRLLWQRKAQNSRIPVVDEQDTSLASTPAVPQFEGQVQQQFTKSTPVPSGSTPSPFWMSNQPKSPEGTENFDTTRLIPLPGGNFGLDFIDPNLYSPVDGESFGDTMFDTNQLEAWTGGSQYLFWEDGSSSIRDEKGTALLPVHSGLPLSPFSNALYGSSQVLDTTGRSEAGSRPLITKKETADEYEAMLEQIQNDENPTMPPPNLIPRGLTPGIRSPTSGTSEQVGRSGSATTSGGHLRNTSAKSPQGDDKNEDGSEEEEAADLLVYFHARSGAESNPVDDSIEVPGDLPRVDRPLSVSSTSSLPAVVNASDMLRKRKRREADEDLAQLSLNSDPMAGNEVDSIGSENMFPGKGDRAAAEKDVEEGLGLDETHMEM
jgi:hypothetical protein